VTYAAAMAAVKLDALGTVVRCDMPMMIMAPRRLRTVAFDDGSVVLYDPDGQAVVHLPAGSVRSVQVVDAPDVKRSSPSWAVALAIVGAFLFLLGLLFLLVKETTVQPGSIVEWTTDDGILAVRVPLAAPYASTMLH